MKTYQTNEDGSISIDTTTIPQGHRFCVQALEEVEAGEANIIPYTKPKPTASELAAPHLAYLASTDWYVIRLLERSIAIPEDVVAARQLAIKELN